MKLRLGKNKIKELEEKIDSLTRKTYDVGSGVVAVVKSDGDSDIGKGVTIPTKDVVRGLKRLYETKPSMFDLMVKILTICTFAVSIIILVVK